MVQDIYHQLWLINKYSTHLESWLEEELTALTISIEEEAAKIENEGMRKWFEVVQSEGPKWHFSEVFPNITRNSIFITCYSLLENELINTCDVLYYRYKCTVQISDFKKDEGKKEKGIRLAKAYLIKVVELQFPDKSEWWDNILHYNLVRNKLVHNEGLLKDDKNSNIIRAYIRKTPSIKLSEDQRIQLSKDFIDEVITTINHFFSELSSLVHQRETMGPFKGRNVK